MKNLKFIFILIVLFIGFRSASLAEDHGGGHSGGGHEEAKPEPIVEEPVDDGDMKIYKLDETGSDVRVPIKIWTEILGEGKLKADDISFTNIRVRFKEKNPGVLIDPEFIVELPRGGGEIDLFRFVKDRPGTFKIFFDVRNMAHAKKAKVFYVSKARKRKLDDQVWGVGCKKFLDVTDFVLKKSAKDGIEVNTTRSRHLSVLMGHFIFAADKRMAQVTFKDSSQPNLNCDTSGEK
jgi:hypothetical protein